MNENNIDWYSVLTGFGSKSMDDIGFFPFVGIMGISLLSSFFISLLYVRFYKPRSTGSLIHRAFPLLGISITAIFIAIQFSLPLSLGLLGALSIVRFRTPIKEPEEIGFIMLVVATSVCCATFNILFLTIILTTAVVALVALRYGGKFIVVNQSDGVIILEIPDTVYHDRNPAIFKAFDDSIKRGRLDSVSENKTETVISFNFQNEQEAKLHRLKQSFIEIDPKIRMSVFYNNTQAI
jgi:hypothetical protein